MRVKNGSFLPGAGGAMSPRDGSSGSSGTSGSTGAFVADGDCLPVTNEMMELLHSVIGRGLQILIDCLQLLGDTGQRSIGTSGTRRIQV